MTPCPAFFTPIQGFGGPKSGPYVCNANTFLTELFPQSLPFLFFLPSLETGPHSVAQAGSPPALDFPIFLLFVLLAVLRFEPKAREQSMYFATELHFQLQSLPS